MLGTSGQGWFCLPLPAWAVECRVEEQPWGHRVPLITGGG